MLVVKKNKSINFSPLGTKLYFHVNSWRKSYMVLTFNIITFSRGCKPRITSYLIVGSIWPVTMPQRAYPLGFAVFFVLGGLLTTPGHAERDNSPSQSSWSTLYMCFGGTSFQEQNWFPSIFQNWCVEFDSSCIIHIKLQPRTILLRQFHLFSNVCTLLLSPLNRKSKPPPHPLFKVVLV